MSLFQELGLNDLDGDDEALLQNVFQGGVAAAQDVGLEAVANVVAGEGALELQEPVCAIM